jgi:hypothetical protein
VAADRPRVGAAPDRPHPDGDHDGEIGMAEKSGKGSDTAKKANAEAKKEGKKNPRTSSAAQSELGKKGGKTKTKTKKS